MTSAERGIEYAKLESEDDLIKKTDPKHFPEIPSIEFKDVLMRY
jgi:hypothetical protein